jgi:hypothetical protein
MNKLFIDEMIIRMTQLNIDNPISAILVVSNGKNLQGFQLRVENLNNVDKVDMITYLLNHLNINIDDIEECKQLNEENILMYKVINRMIEESKNG